MVQRAPVRAQKLDGKGRPTGGWTTAKGGEAVAMLDVNADGWLDAAVVDGAHSYHLYRNHARRTGERTLVSTPVLIGPPRDGRLYVAKALGTHDFDADGRLDFFVANDATPNHHWFQRPDGTFEERAVMQGTAVNLLGRVEAGMGVAAIDIDEDDDLDLFLSHLGDESNTLYLKEGAVYDDATDRFGLGG